MTLPDRIRVLERGWLSSNNIVFLDDAAGASVVDTGYVTHIDETIRLIDEAREGRPLRRIVNTHIHSDHAGGNARLKALHGCEVWIPPGEADLVDAWDEDALSYRRTSQQCPPFSYDGLIHPHDTLHLGGEDWTVLPAAGHDHAMVMLWCAHLGILLSADALWQK
ncbi:MBL fold metallo-hydrolase, partial [Aquabacterium sp.]|uniref:MBL fold metallo-hydrolase n=1 Tax=Aquabacterium sp. TaxID=1872578 RepID=UPI0040376D9F